MENKDKTKEELLKEIQELKQLNNALKGSVEKHITEREQIKEALHQNETKFRLLAQNSSDVVWTVDTNYRLTYVSPSVYRLRGIPAEEAILEPFENTMPPQSQAVIYKAIITSRKHEKEKNYPPTRLEIEQYHKDGSLIWVEMTIRPILNKRGEKTGYVGVSRDVTKCKQTQKKLKESLNRFDSLVTKIPVGIYILRIHTNGQMKFEYVSDRWCEIFQLKREEALNDISNVHQHFHEEDIEQFLALNQQAALTLKPFLWEGRFFSGGKIRWLHIESIPIPNNHENVRWYGVTQDITQRKQAELALRDSEIQLREINAQKDKFFSIIAHDLRSPFTSILGFSEILLDQIKEQDYNGIEKHAKIINQTAQLTMNLLMNLLKWSQTQTGRIAFNPEIFVLDDILNQNIPLFSTIAGQKAIRINKDVAPDIAVFADKQMISTVVRNLISNAIKFTHQGGEINISAEKRKNDVLISVSDNGIGIKTERLETLFRIDKTDSTDGTNDEMGTGLGLVLCKEFIEKHGGEMRVKSKPQKGSTFYFMLPHSDNSTKHLGNEKVSG